MRRQVGRTIERFVAFGTPEKHDFVSLFFPQREHLPEFDVDDAGAFVHCKSKRIFILYFAQLTDIISDHILYFT